MIGDEVLNKLGDNNNFSKNPIGVIGIFLVLTEFIASIVIVESTLNTVQNTILVIFIVLFPCLVLFAFYLLVTRHHEKLYSPSDYKDEKNFVNTYNSATQKNDIKKLVDSDSWKDEIADSNLELIKDVLANILKIQKKIIPSMEDSVLSEDDKNDYVANMDEYLSEIDEENKQFYIEISRMYKSTRIVEELTQQGYTANLYSFGADKKFVSNREHEAIWLGDKIPIDMAINVIKIAKKYYPHLKYIKIDDALDDAPSFVKYEIFIGGSTKTAKEMRLRALDEKDFNRIYQMKDINELHDYIKKFSG